MNPNDDALGAKADAAFRQVARKVIEKARQAGTPIYLWEEGKVVERTWEEMEQLLGKETADDRAQPSAATNCERVAQ
jgi:hypothetical protein